MRKGIKSISISILVAMTFACDMAIPRPFVDGPAMTAVPTSRPSMTGQQEPATPAMTSEFPVIVYVMADYVNLRTIPDAYGPDDSNVMATLQRGDALELLQCAVDEKGNEWLFVTSIRHGKTGWVMADYISPHNCK